jgi:hypothetical protein
MLPVFWLICLRINPSYRQPSLSRSLGRSCIKLRKKQEAKLCEVCGAATFSTERSLAQDGAEAARYGYDGIGLRLFKDTTTGTVIYHNGPDGNVLSEMSDQGRSLADYVYLNGRLIARVGDPNRVNIVPWLHLLLKDAN